MEETISFKEFIGMLKKRTKLIGFITICALLISAIVSFFIMTPIYQSSSQILVNQNKSGDVTYEFSEVQTNLQLINTYNVIIKSPAILDIVRKELDLDITSQQLNNKISVLAEKNSQIVTVSVQDTDAEQAAEIANKTVEVFKKEIVTIMNVDNVTILSKAVALDEQTPIKPKPLLNLTFALVVGFFIGLCLAFLMEYLDNTVKNENDLEKLLGLPVLGAIGVIDESKSDQRVRRGKRRREVRGESIGV
ncbi:MAG: ywqC [Bacillales bacterium]|jgi:capsular polysaccharide biosynthesis protein|nr:ywqC [Bacillales bacterium]